MVVAVSGTSEGWAAVVGKSGDAPTHMAWAFKVWGNRISARCDATSHATRASALHIWVPTLEGCPEQSEPYEATGDSAKFTAPGSVEAEDGCYDLYPTSVRGSG